MSGHIRNKGHRQDGSTKWEARWRNPLNPMDRHERTFRRKEIAERWLHEMDANAYGGKYADPRRADRPLQDVAAEWSETWLDLEPKTIAGYDHILRKHILPKFAAYRIGALNAQVLQHWVTDLAASRQSNTTRNIYAVMRGLLKFATTRHYIAVNPCDAVRLPKRAARRTQLYLTPSEVNALAANMPANYQLPVYVAAYCGLRAGELWALRRQDIDLLNGRINVEQALKEVYTAQATDHKGLILGPTKSAASRRTVTIPGPIKAMLIDHLARLLPGGQLPASLIFTTPNGYAVRHGRFYNKVYRPAVAQTWPLPHRLHRLRFHDLRHTCAALSLAVTPNLHVVKQRLGHEDIRTTINVYGHLLPSVDVALADGLGQMFSAADTPPDDNVRALRPLDGSDASC